MGLFSSIANVVKTAITKPIQSLSAGVQAVAVAVANPVTLVTQGYSAAYQKTASSSLASNITKIVVNTGTVAAATVGAGTVAGRAAVTTIAKAAVANPVKSTVAAAAVPVVYGAITSHPIETVKGTVETASSLSNFGSNVADFAVHPTIQNAVDIVKENPVITSAVALAGIATVGGGIGLAANTLATYTNTKATNNNSEPAPIETKEIPQLTYSPIPAVAAPQQVAPAGSSSAPAKKKTTKKKKKTTKKKKKTTKKKKKTTRRSKKKSIKRKKS